VNEYLWHFAKISVRINITLASADHIKKPTDLNRPHQKADRVSLLFVAESQENLLDLNVVMGGPGPIGASSTSVLSALASSLSFRSRSRSAHGPLIVTDIGVFLKPNTQNLAENWLVKTIYHRH